MTLRPWASLMTMANSSPPIRPTWPESPTSLTSRWATLFSTASPFGWPNVSLTGLKPSRSRNRIAQGTLPAVAARSASPSSWRTRPRLGKPDSTSTLARCVSRSCVWRISVMSEPTPRKPSKRPAVSTIGSPAIEIHRGPRADVSDAILAIDFPQPADAALLIFLQQQARAFALAADVGVRLELVERPPGDRQHAEDRDA